MEKKKKLVVLTGAGISAESGIKTFRDSGGLWEGHDVMQVASSRGWKKNRHLVLDFYNQRRAQLAEVEPNKAHTFLAELETKYDVQVITQNVDNLHERGGSTKIMHLHGELTKARSTSNNELVYDVGYDPINEGDMCSDNSQLRPHIVWFGEAVPMMEKAIMLVMQADIFLIIGTSMEVYPAANLIDYVPAKAKKIIIDPRIPDGSLKNFEITKIQKTATKGLAELNKHLDI
ncbi:UNVERIFIED_CONTAM: hypothetical protein GTU68_055269 [Idotea baltica]|nr:hypothetical protein [Idotea baltica]